MNDKVNNIDFRFAQDDKELTELIKLTPRSCKEDVEFYHSKIIQLIDSGYYCEVPSLDHRNLHQKIWIAAHMVYKGLSDFNEATFDYLAENGDKHNGDFVSQRNRFNIWYDKTYIKPYLEKIKNLNWALRTREDDNAMSLKVLNIPLEEAYQKVRI